MGELEDAQAKIKELEPLAGRVTELSKQVVDLTAARDTATGDLAGVRDEVAKSKAETEGLKGQLQTANAAITTHEDVTARLTALTESNANLETRHQESVVNRLKGLGMAEEVYKDKSIEQIEAMELALGSVKLQVPTGGNSTGSEKDAGLTGGSGSTGTVVATGLEAEQDMYEKAKARGK